MRILADTSNLFRLNFWIAVGMGLSLSISLPLISLWLDLVVNTGWITSEGPSFIIAMLFAALVMGVVGVGLWRATFVSQMTGEALIGLKRSALGLTIGFVTGELVYHQQFIPATKDALGQPIPSIGIVFNIAFGLLWAASLAAYLLLVFRWISSSARIWLAEANGMHSPRPVYIPGLLLAGGIFVWGVGVLFLLRKILGSMVISSTVQIMALIQVLFGFLIDYLQHPVTFLLLITLWAFPMLAWLRRRRSTPILPAEWAFLGSASGLMPRQELRPGLAVGIGLSAGFLYLAFQVVLRLLVRATGLSDTINSDQALLVWFFIAQVALAVLVQLIAAAVTAILVKQIGWAHGLFAAFVGGCMMTVEFLAVGLLFGGGLDPNYVWISTSYIINTGALASMVLVLGLLGITNWLRRFRKEAPQPISQPTAS